MTITKTPVFSQQTIQTRNLEILQKNFPQALEVDALGRYTINAAKLQLALDPAGVKVEEDGYELRWVGKREAYHTAFTPAQKILNPLPADSKNWDSTGNLLLRGDNLDALRLLRQSYFGKVKLIYIDPPYNTQSDAFIYKDNFSANPTQILEELGYDKDNIEYIKNIYGAKTHSGWLSFMYPRLLLAKELLRNDGVIFISIDDNEQAQLRLLCDEVFGQDGFLGTFVWRRRASSALAERRVSTDHEYIAAYHLGDFTSNGLKKDYKNFSNSDSDDRGDWVAGDLTVGMGKDARPNQFYELIDPKTKKCYKPNPNRVWAYIPESMDKLIKEGKVIFPSDTDRRPMLKRFKSELKADVNPISTWLNEVGLNTEATKEMQGLFGKNIFDYSKPSSLIQRLIRTSTNNQDIILDFFAGSGTTGEAVMCLNAEDGGNRQFILVQIPQPIDAKKQKEAYHFVTDELGKPATIFEITAERLRRAGTRLEQTQAANAGLLETRPLDTGFRVFDVVDDPDALILDKPLSEATQDDLDFFIAPQDVAELALVADMPIQQSQVLHNLLLAEGLPLTTRLIEVIAHKLYLAGDVALILRAIELTVLSDTLTRLKVEGTPAVHLTLYARWIRDDNFTQGIKTLAESLGYSSDKLRLRG